MPGPPSAAGSILAALGWVMLGLGSLTSLVFATWVVGAMASADAPEGASAIGSWALALLVTVGLPFAIAAWKHQGDVRRMSLTMAWLPMVWNTTGLLVGTQLVPDLVASALRRQGAWATASALGDAHDTTQALSILGHHAADVLAPAPGTERGAPPLPSELSSALDHSRALSLPLAEDGTGILLEATFEGPKGRVSRPYLWDTGATFTTVTSKTLAELGVPVPADAPVITFNTASGPRESQIVVVPAIEIGRVRIEGLLVSVCDRCPSDHGDGLLGLNVMRHFFVQMDYEAGRILLIPRAAEGRRNQAFDIGRMVSISVDGTAMMWGGRIRWVLLVKNRSTVPLYDVVPTVKFTGGGKTLRGARIERIDPGEVGRSRVEGRFSDEGTDAQSNFSLALDEAFW